MRCNGFYFVKKFDLSFFNKIETVTSHKKDFSSVIIISVLFQTLVVFTYFFAAKALGDITSFYYFLLFIPVTILVGFLPLTLNGLGAREGAMVVLLGLAGMSKTVALTSGLIVYFLLMVNSLVGGLVFILESKSSKI